MPRAPRPVLPGATVGVIAPSSPFPAERFETGMAALTALGFTVRVHPAAYAVDGYLAGDDATRTRALHEFLDDPTIDAVWAARGGYGLHRLLPHIDGQRIARAGKAIVGFSDVCALHALALVEADLIGIHGPVITQLGDVGAEATAHAAKILAGHWRDVTYAAEGPAITVGRAAGPLVGGCLSVIAPLIGTPFLPPLEGAILLLEDVGEATYRIDRLLTHLALAGVLSRVAGVALGEFVGCAPRKEGEQTLEAIFADRFGALGVPVIQGLPFGHGRKNLAVPLGARVEIDADRGRLTLLGS